MEITSIDVQHAYLKLKQYVYYDKTDLRLRRRLAEFECSDQFSEKFGKVATVLNSKEPWATDLFKQWLGEIAFRLVPKKVVHDRATPANPSGEGTYITNIPSSSVTVSAVNYFFDGPIELHLVAVLWIMKEGKYLDASLGSECRGS